MAIDTDYQFGIDDAKVSARTADGTLAATKVDVLGVNSFSCGVESDSVEHRGDNQALRIRKTGKKVAGSVEQAATSLAAYAVVSDGATVSSGVTPAVIVTYTEPATAPGKRYQIEAQAADVGGATRFTVLNASTVSGPMFEWAEGEFSNPSWDYEGIAYSSELFTIKQYETEVPIGTTNP